MSHIIFVITTTFLLFPMLYQDYRRYLKSAEEKDLSGKTSEINQEIGAPETAAELYIKIIFCKFEILKIWDYIHINKNFR